MSRETTSLVFSPDYLIDKYIDRSALERYFEALMTHNQKVNLVSRETSPDDLVRLAAESVLPLEVLSAERDGVDVESYLDIGSGGGFPSVPILLARNIETARLVERTAKKASVLEKIIEELGLDAGIIPRNLEEIKFDRTFKLITLRYVKLTEPLLKKIYALLNEGGHFVYYSATDIELHQNRAHFYSFESSEPPVTKSFTIYEK